MTKKYTPMMMQYLKIKEKHKDALILFRLGDFYELFFDDAKTASRELQLTLTGKNAGVDEKVPMCGVPHHAINSYIDKLIKKGYKVGIVEQLEDPVLAKGLVERDVVQIITPGAVIDVKEKDNNYLGCLDEQENYYIFSYADVSTGEVFVENLEKDIEVVINEVNNLNIREVVVATSFDQRAIIKLQQRNNTLISYENNNSIEMEHEFILTNVKDLFQRMNVVRLVNYLKNTQRRELDYLKQVKVLYNQTTLQIDAFSRVNLELVRTIRSDDRYGSLFWLLDQTSTNMGSRLLRKWIMKPTCDLNEIIKRQNVITSLIENFLVRDDLNKDLKDIYDLERLIAKINFGNASGRDLLQLRRSLEMVPKIISDLKLLSNEEINQIIKDTPSFSELTSLLAKAISEDAPITVKDGGIFNLGYNAELDELINLSSDGKSWVAKLENYEKERTGIKTLKVGYNRVFGYYIEVSKGALSQIKEEFGFERKQTTINSERFITRELKEKEAMILNADEKRCAMEYELFNQLRKTVAEYTNQIQELASTLSYIDCLIAFAEVSVNQRFVKPTFNDKRSVRIIQGRHPVIEKVSSKNYVSNDIILDGKTDILVITGPNMGGKSTYMRQFALIVILAQMGCFVPAKEADLMLFDAIFTRIGASDDLVSGQSTFMVEMNETNYALRHATSNSLLIFDEIGRGTATFDGMALAQSILEYIATHIQAKTLFSTHYHEITAIEEKLPMLKNIHVSVVEDKDDITFLYKVKEGAMNRSYGINVARLANLPEELLIRANEVLKSLENKKVNVPSNVIVKEKEKEKKYIEDLKKLDPLTLSPLDALNYLYELKKKMKED